MDWLDKLLTSSTKALLLSVFMGVMFSFGFEWARRFWARRKGRRSGAEETNDKLAPTVVSTQKTPEKVERTGIVELQEITFKNVRSFEKLAFPILRSRTDGQGQWVLLLGDNGIGKSTILRSLVLAITEPSTAGALLQIQRSPAPYVRMGEKFAKIDVRLSDDRAFHVTVTPGPPVEDLKSFGDNSFRPAIFAYGAQRGSALGGAARHISFSPLSDVSTLFDESAELIQGETWLKQIRLAALESRGGAGEAFYEAIQRTLIDLLPGVRAIECDADGVWVSGNQIGRHVPLAAMSDGYLTTTGWILDLIARWANRVEQLEGRKPDGTIAREIDGLVLIDEIDLHLHPLWQMDVVSCLRQSFPRLSFVASTHNPLTLLGAQPGEIHVLRRDPETNVVMIEQRDVPPGMRADQVLTGYWFGLSSTLDKETLDLLEEHRRLLQKGSGRSQPVRLRLERELRRRLGTFADTSVDRMALQVAAEVMEEEQEEYSELSVEQREQIRGKILSRLEEKRKEQRRG
jgi:energy-coupling factor transporter ATP-binding protein EcfA2